MNKEEARVKQEVVMAKIGAILKENNMAGAVVIAQILEGGAAGCGKIFLEITQLENFVSSNDEHQQISLSTKNFENADAWLSAMGDIANIFTGIKDGSVEIIKDCEHVLVDLDNHLKAVEADLKEVAEKAELSKLGEVGKQVDPDDPTQYKN